MKPAVQPWHVTTSSKTATKNRKKLPELGIALSKKFNESCDKSYDCATKNENYHYPDEIELDYQRSKWIKGVSFDRNCGAALVGEYNRVI